MMKEGDKYIVEIGREYHNDDVNYSVYHLKDTSLIVQPSFFMCLEPYDNTRKRCEDIGLAFCEWAGVKPGRFERRNDVIGYLNRLKLTGEV